MLKLFSRDFFLVGGTAIALQIGHRRSIDFDLFRRGGFDPNSIKDQIEKAGHKFKEKVNNSKELTGYIDEVQFTFYNYPFDVKPSISFNEYIKMPSLLDLAAMKTDALGGRARWKDYIDLYYLLRDFVRIKDVEQRARTLFKKKFDRKIFRLRLTCFYDIDINQGIEFMKNFKVTQKEVENFLTQEVLKLPL
jgi:hypothetical protein